MNDSSPKRVRRSSRLQPRAAELRRRATIAEARLWHALRGRKLGVRVRRQHPLGPFITDFCIVEHRLVIEIDGSIHTTQADRDLERTAYLEGTGYRVVRFTNDQVIHDLDRVLENLQDALAMPQQDDTP